MSELSRRGSAWDKLAGAIKERDGGYCQYNGPGCTGDVDLTVDHILPLNKGGTDDDWNLVTACRTCNGRKQDKVMTRRPWRDKAWFPDG